MVPVLAGPKLSTFFNGGPHFPCRRHGRKSEAATEKLFVLGPARTGMINQQQAVYVDIGEEGASYSSGVVYKSSK